MKFSNRLRIDSQSMSKEEKTILKDTEEEFNRRGGFKMIFPTHNYLSYKQFFEEERPLNMFLYQK